MTTPDTITDDQIRELLSIAKANGWKSIAVLCKLALGESVVYRDAQLKDARRRVAEILNARAEGK